MLGLVDHTGRLELLMALGSLMMRLEMLVELASTRTGDMGGILTNLLVVSLVLCLLFLLSHLFRPLEVSIDTRGGTDVVDLSLGQFFMRLTRPGFHKDNLSVVVLDDLMGGSCQAP